jgi:hypothetical protein
LEAFSKFKRRWFEVKPPYLIYSKTVDQKIPSGIISLSDAEVKQNKSYSKYPFAFDVKEAESGEQVVLSAASQRDMEDWMAMLSPAANGARFDSATNNK